MPYSNLVINPNAGTTPSFGGLDTSQWSLSNAVQSSHNTGGNGSAFGGMMSNLLSGGLGALGSIASSLISGAFAKRAQQRQFKMNQLLMDKQNQMQRDMLVDEMALKMQGYKNAGLSTASLAGNFSNNVAVPSSNVGAPQGTAHDMRLGDIFNAARQVKLQEMAIQSQIDLNEAQADALLSNARKTNADATVTEHYGLKTAASTLQNIDQNTRLQLSQEEKTWTDRWNSINLTDAQIRQIDGQLDIAYQQLPLQLQVLASEVFKNQESGKLSIAQAAEAYQAIRESAKRIEKLSADIGLTSAQTAVAWALAALHEKQKETEGYRGLYEKKQAQLAQLDYDVANSMGMSYYHLRNVMQVINPLTWIMGAVGISRNIPSTHTPITGFR